MIVIMVVIEMLMKMISEIINTIVVKVEVIINITQKTLLSGNYESSYIKIHRHTSKIKIYLPPFSLKMINLNFYDDDCEERQNDLGEVTLFSLLEKFPPGAANANCWSELCIPLRRSCRPPLPPCSFLFVRSLYPLFLQPFTPFTRRSYFSFVSLISPSVFTI